MDDEPMWAADRVVAPTPGSAITIPETKNEFAIKDLLTSNLDDLLDLFQATLNQTPRGSNSKAYQPPQARNEHVNVVFTRSGKSYNPPDNPDNQQKNSKNPINFDSDDEDDEPTLQPKTQPTKPIKETPLPKPYKPEIPRNAYVKFLKELISNKQKIEQIFPAFLSDESSAMIQNKVPPKLGDPRSFLILYKGSKILHSIEGTLLKEEIFSEFDEFMAMTADENSESEFDTEEPPFAKITINTDYKIKTSLEEPLTDELSFLPMIISSQLSAQNKSKLVFCLRNVKTFASGNI
ncbi:hypothetical protein Tco_0195557 [Tanacetum coccineum]